MTAARASYRKTILLAGIGAGIAFATAIGIAGLFSGLLPEWVRATVLAVMGFAVMTGSAVVLSGLLVLHREGRHERGDVDLFNWLNCSRSECAIGAIPAARTRILPLRTLRRLAGAQSPLPGDLVHVRPLGEILATLDESGCLDGLPFMPEMIRFCGREARVFRSIDKIYDYGGRKDLRRMRDCVSLVLPRCDGAAHGGCQAGCALMWKTSWLDPVGRERRTAGPLAAAVDPVTAATGLDRHTRRRGTDGYTCQFTELVRATVPMSAKDVRQDLRPLALGNTTFAAWIVAIASRFFNWIQGLRGGVGYLTIRPAAATSAPQAVSFLREGEPVVVRSRADIAHTLDRYGRNKGLWFDRDMLKHCEREYRVLWRVDRIIDDVHGSMLRMKTPCFVLDGLVSSGEWLRFCPQHDFPFWRQAWLQRASGSSASAPGAVDGA